jgi:hypothetical protein
MTSTTEIKGYGLGNAAWPSRPEPVHVSPGGNVFHIESGRRSQGAVRMFWQPDETSVFWRERGILSTTLGALVGQAGSAGPSVVERLESRGLHLRITESDLHCSLDITGEQEALRACIGDITAAIAHDDIDAATATASARRFAHERAARLQRMSGQAEVRHWRHFVESPTRTWRDTHSASADVDQLRAIVTQEPLWPNVGGIVVVGRDDLASVCRDAVAAAQPAVRRPASAPRPVMAPRTGERIIVVPGRPRGQSFISYGAIHPVATLHEAFEQELALEILAGWSGSRLTDLLRHQLALTYSVYPGIRPMRIADLTLLVWSISLQTASIEVETVLEHIDVQVRMLLTNPDEAEIRRAAVRILRRLRLYEDSVDGILVQDGGNTETGFPHLARERWQFLRTAGAPEVVRGLRRIVETGVFVVIDGSLITSGAGGAHRG